MQSALGGGNATILRLFKNRKPAEVRVGEEDGATEVGESSPLGREDGTNRGTRHRVPHSHNVHTRYALADVWMDTLKIAEDSFLPVVPITTQEHPTVLGWSSFGKGPVESPHRTVHMGPQGLMGGIDVTQSW